MAFGGGVHLWLFDKLIYMVGGKMGKRGAACDLVAAVHCPQQTPGVGLGLLCHFTSD